MNTEKTIQIDKLTERLTVGQESIPLTITQMNNENEIIIHKNTIYKSYTMSGIGETSIPWILRVFYKNWKLRNINIFIDQDYINSTYSKPIDETDYITPYIDYCEKTTNDLLQHLIDTTKRKFNWEKISILTDPRVYETFIEIRYY